MGHAWRRSEDVAEELRTCRRSGLLPPHGLVRVLRDPGLLFRGQDLGFRLRVLGLRA